MMNEPQHTRVLDLSRRERNIALVIVAAAVLLMGGLIAMFWRPAPPKVVVMSTGPLDGAYHAFGLQYQQILGRAGIRLVLKPSTGAVENLERLRNRQEGVTIALVQGGIARPDDGSEIDSLGGMFYEPVWVFTRTGTGITGLASTSGKRIAAGPPGSGTRLLADTVFAASMFAEGSPPVLLDAGGLAAARALQGEEVDAAMFVSAPDAPAVQQLLRAPGISLLSFRRAEAFTRRFPYFTKLELPEGAVDLGRNLPPADTLLVASTASLVVANDIHPVIIDMMLDAARQIHGRGSLISRPGRFPSAETAEYPLSADAERFYKSGPSGLTRYLPFWAVVWIQRLLFLGLPILGIGIPLLRFMPVVYRWSMRRRIYRWYGELAFIERAAKQGQGDRQLQQRRLDDIDGRVSAMRVPPAFASEAYTLKMHVQMVRGLLASPPHAASEAPEPAP
jgi:TRAP-type uncharacterized transport system substrate-binding protein